MTSASSTAFGTNGFGFTNPYAPKATNPGGGMADIASFWADMFRTSLTAFAPPPKAPEPVAAPFNVFAGGPFAVWADSVNAFVTTMTAPPRPTPSPFDPFGLMRAITAQPSWPGLPAPSANPFAMQWPWTMTPWVAPAPAFGNPFALPFAAPALPFWAQSLATWPFPAAPQATAFDAFRIATPAVPFPITPFSAYRTAGGHAVAQIMAPVADTLTAMARLNPVIAAAMPAPVTPSWLATLPPWRFFNA